MINQPVARKRRIAWTALAAAIMFSAAGVPAIGAGDETVAGLSRRLDVLEVGAARFAMPYDRPVPPAEIPNASARAPVVVAQSDSAIADLSIRIDRLESQMRQQTGQFEEILFKLQRLEEQLRRMQDDNEFRFQELESGIGKRKRSAVEPPPSSTGTTSGRAVSSGSTGQSAGGEPQVLGELNLGSDPAGGDPAGGDLVGGRPFDLSALIRNDGIVDPAPDPAPSGQQLTLAPSADPRDEYDLAYGYVLRGDYALAETSFRDFLAKHSGHRLAGDARFWLGEALYNQRRYREAADSFLAVYNDYPSNSKVPDSLLKLAASLAQLGEIPTACATYDKLLSDYPNASRTVRAAATADHKKYRC
ncbi:MAG: tol-pal system protein YbgF [Hyphomicrobiales bacterium]|nr:tol-pal system protein YbgF [Hyphomicrobiales bacterium]